MRTDRFLLSRQTVDEIWRLMSSLHWNVSLTRCHFNKCAKGKKWISVKSPPELEAEDDKRAIVHCFPLNGRGIARDLRGTAESLDLNCLLFGKK